jgi:hypothetical protein
MGGNNVVGIATRYGLDDLGIKPWWGLDFTFSLFYLSAVNIRVCSDVAPYRVVNIFRCFEGKYFHLKDRLTTYYFDRSVTIYRSACCNISAEFLSGSLRELQMSQMWHCFLLCIFCFVRCGYKLNWELPFCMRYITAYLNIIWNTS